MTHLEITVAIRAAVREAERECEGGSAQQWVDAFFLAWDRRNLDVVQRQQAGAASRSADVQPADCNAAKQWLTQRMPAELPKLVAMLDASSDQSETLGEWAGELALSAYAAGYQAAVDVQPADDVPVSEWSIDSGWLTVGSDSVRISVITSVRLCQYGEPDVFVGYIGFSVPIHVTFADVDAARRGHVEILRAIMTSEAKA